MGNNLGNTDDEIDNFLHTFDIHCCCCSGDGTKDWCDPAVRSDCEDDPVLDGGDQELDWGQEDCAVTRNCGDEEQDDFWAWLFGLFGATRYWGGWWNPVK